MSRSASPALLLVAVLAAGCPSPTGEAGGAAAHAPSPDHATPTPAPASTTGTGAETAPPPREPSPGPAGPAGPAGPMGPAPMATPDPSEGRHQLDLLPRRQLKVGDVPVTVWIADGYATRRLGLMHVRELPPDHGMLFVYPDVRERSFWMRNTFIPLSIAYIDERGRIASIVDMQPHDERSHPSGAPVRFGLEMAQGWFRARGISPGARVDGITNLPGYE